MDDLAFAFVSVLPSSSKNHRTRNRDEMNQNLNWRRTGRKAALFDKFRHEPFNRLPLEADVAELADALASGASDRKVVEVRLLSSAVLIRRIKKLYSWRNGSVN